MRRHPILWAAGFYAVLTCVLTFPQVLYIHDGLPTDADGVYFEDPFLNSWILGWGARAAVTDPIHIFDANAFWPRRNSLAYSDHMLGHLPLTIPLFWLTRNAILVHNTILLLTFATSGLTAFLLVRSITGAAGPALLAGTVYAFCPFRFEEYGHVQVLSVHWIPLALWCLHRFHARMAADGSFPWRPYVGLIAFGTLQSLCSTYFSIYFPVFVGCFAVTSAFWGRKGRLRRAAWTLLAPLIWTTLTLPTVMPYVKLKQTMGFTRDLHQNVRYSAVLSSFFATPRSNRLYGALSDRFRGPEATGFPGAAVCLLSLVAVVWLVRSRAWGSQCDRRGRLGWIYLLCGIAMASLALGPRIRFLGEEVCWGPYLLLYKFVPGFAGLRAPARFLMLVMLCLSVLTGLGAWRLCSSLSERWRRGVIAGLIAILMAEYAAVPIPLRAFPVWDRVPELYRWLAKQTPQKRIVEVPLDLSLRDMQRMYYSTYHWHRIVNGKSGISPPESTVGFLSYVVPSPSLVDLMSEMKIDYVVTDDSLMPDLSNLYLRSPAFRLEKIFGQRKVFRFLDEVVRGSPPPFTVEQLDRVPTDEWRPMTNVHAENADLTRDGDPSTSWTTATDQKAGTVFALAFARLTRVRLVRIGFGRHAQETPRYLIARVTEDGRKWQKVFGRPQWPDAFARIYRSALHSPRNPVLDLYVTDGTWRGLELRLVRSACASWAMAEIEVYEAPAGR